VRADPGQKQDPIQRSGIPRHRVSVSGTVGAGGSAPSRSRAYEQRYAPLEPVGRSDPCAPPIAVSGQTRVNRLLTAHLARCNAFRRSSPF
jgi:hypothetical protein